MANTLFDYARKLFAQGDIDWVNDSFKTVLVDTGAYTPVFETHKFLSDIPTSARTYGTTGAAGVALANPGVDANGAVYGDNVRFVTVAAEDPAVDAICIYRDVGGVEANSEIIYWADTATGLPIQPNGGDIIVTWNTGTNRIFRL